MQQSIQKLSPLPLHDIWMKNRDRRRQLEASENLVDLRNDDDYYTPPYRTDFISRFPLFHLPSLWNQFPPDIQIIRKKTEFCLALKKQFIDLLSDTPNCTRLLCPSCHLQNIINSP